MSRDITTRWKKLWEEALDDLQKNKIRQILENFIMFFRFQGSIYGAPESSRVTFANMRHPNEDDGDWLRDASFTATNLFKLGQGKQEQVMFGKKELNSIDILSKEQARHDLEEYFSKLKDDKTSI